MLMTVSSEHLHQHHAQDESVLPQARRFLNPRSDAQGEIRCCLRVRYILTSFNAQPGTTYSAPNTPIANTFRSTPSAPPPVPAVPDAYARRPSTVRPSTSPTISRAGEASPRKSSIDITIDSPKLSPLPPVEPLARERSNQSLSPKDLRRRSLSMNSATAATLLHLGAAGSDRPGAPPAPKRVSNRTEEDRLKKELQRWKLDLDGVLGSIGDGVGGLSPDLSARTASTKQDTPPSPTASSPRVDLPNFAPIEAAFMGRSASNPPKRPKWNDEWLAQGEPVVTKRSASLPTSSLSPLPPLPVNEAEEQQDTTPQILLVSPVTDPPTDDSPVEMLASPAMASEHSPDTADEPSPSSSTPVALPPAILDGLGSSNRRHSTQEGLGLGLGLATISESSHSRDSSLTTPTKADTTPRRPHTADATLPPPPFLFTQSESPSSNGAPSSTSAVKLSNQRNRAARQSVVTYPSAVRPGSLPNSMAGSTVSLGSEPSLRGGGHKSMELGPGDETSGEAFEERGRIAAQRCWDEDASFIEPKKIAEWLGSA